MVACFTSIKMAPRARPRPWATRTLMRTMERVSRNVMKEGFRPPIQYDMVTNIVGRISSIGKSPTVLAK